MHVGCLILDRATRVKIARLLELQCTLHFCTTQKELANAVALLPIVLILTEPHDTAGAPLHDTISRLRRAHPALTIAVCTGVSLRSVREAFQLGKAGADLLIVTDHDSEMALLGSAVGMARCRCTRTVAMEAITPYLGAVAAGVVEYCFDCTLDELTVQAMANGLGVSRRTLLNLTIREKLPPPATLISWCRVLHAARLLEESEESIERIAFALRFSTPKALRDRLIRLTGLRPSEIRTQGGFTTVLEHFVAVVHPGRGLETADGEASYTTRRASPPSAAYLGESPQRDELALS